MVNTTFFHFFKNNFRPYISYNASYCSVQCLAGSWDINFTNTVSRWQSQQTDYPQSVSAHSNDSNLIHTGPLILLSVKIALKARC